jgi:hypothetical protein
VGGRLMARGKSKNRFPKEPAVCKYCDEELTTLTDDYLALSAGWHFLQTLPFSAAVWQHLWSHFFPASTVASQQGFLGSSAARRFEMPKKANAQTAINDNLMAFMFFSVFGRSTDRPFGFG